MIISHLHKFAFFRIPKTGSVTTNVLLRMEGMFGPDDILSKAIRMGFDHQNLGASYEAQFDNEWDLIHATPTEAVDVGLITLGQLEEYDCFATIRDPYDRWLSTMVHIGILPSAWHMSKALDHYSDNAGEKLSSLRTLARGQAPYFDTGFIEPLDFRLLDMELRRIVLMVGGRSPRGLPTLNSRRRELGSDPFIWNPVLEAKVDAMFPEDIILWKKFNE